MEKQVVTITVEGGVIQYVNCPEGVTVIVKDYDSEGCDEDFLVKDESGDEYVESIYEHEVDWFEPPITPGDQKCAHTEHCCIKDGCKYNDILCPIWLGYKSQSYTCESCWSDWNEDVHTKLDRPEIPKVTKQIIELRRQESIDILEG